MATNLVDGKKYRLIVLEQGFGESEIKGSPYFFLQFHVLRGYNADGTLENGDLEIGGEYRQDISTDTGVGILCGDLKSLGITISSLMDLHPEADQHRSLIGRELDGTCAVEHFTDKNGNDRTRVKWRIRSSKLSLERVATLNTQLGGCLRKESAPRANGGTGNGGSDDGTIPF
jgi:hypothetical protein